MHVFRHPKFYEEYRKRAKRYQKELRDAGNELAKRDAVKEDLARPGSSPARNKSDQVISNAEATAASERAPDQGQSIKPQAPSSKLQAPSVKLRESQASSDKRQALRCKRQA